jgi:DNA-binding XRE family transcriptional regulator
MLGQTASQNAKPRIPGFGTQSRDLRFALDQLNAHEFFDGHSVSDSNPAVYHLGQSVPFIDKNRDAFACSRMESFSDTIRMMRVARALLELSQEDLAKRAGVGRQTIVRIEAGGKGVAFDAVAKVRGALEKGGVIFLPPTAEHGPAIALRSEKAKTD